MKTTYTLLGLFAALAIPAHAERKPNIGSIKYYRPSGDPDAPYDDFKDYI